MSEAQVASNAKSKTEYEAVTMSDGRVVNFPGKRRMLKDVVIEGDTPSVRIDFRNGTTGS